MSQTEGTVGKLTFMEPSFVVTKDEDWFLQNLVSILDDAEHLEVPISLNVGGGIITGLAIGGAAYFKQFAKDYANAWRSHISEEMRANLQESFAHFATIYDKPDTQGHEAESPKHPPRYVHLKDAQTVFGNVFIPNQGGGVLWRGRIASVSGFSLGNLKSS